MTGIFLYTLAGVLLLLSLIRDRKKTLLALLKAWRQFLKLLPSLLAIMLFMGLTLSLLDITVIGRFIGGESGFPGVLAGLFLGSVIFLPGFLAFPLASTLLNYGAGYPQMAAFISTLMGVGITTLPIEIRYFGRRTALYRNLLCFIAASAFALIIGRLF